jgi:AmmeMemoRadiSam system protein B
VLGAGSLEAGERLTPAELEQLATHARTNLAALVRGLTPSYYTYGVADGAVAGLILTVDAPGRPEPGHFAQISLRPGIPIQATLFRLCEHAAQSLRLAAAQLGSVRVGLTVLYDPAMHGTAAEPDLRGFDAARRALLLIEQEKSAAAYLPALAPEQILETVRDAVPLLNPAGAGLFGLAAQSTEPSVIFSSAPRPTASAAARRPAVAGQFYPGDASALDAMVGELLGGSERRPAAWPAAMVPHAGLRFSGGLAAAVFNRLEFPELVIVIGPKHTRLGVDWAVAPHESWVIPGATLPADPALAARLFAAIPGLQPDAAAHQQEHAIEVELPFLARLAPSSRVVGIAVGGGNWERCRQFAHGLASVVRELPRPPLLLISSDMNHFATDNENRRLDELALKAMETRDPERLLAVVADHNISMCGVLPAVIVMEALRQLGGLETVERVGYATSADVTGDTSRVVGYAGMLLG